MKHQILSVILIASCGAYAQKSMADFDKKYVNWYNEDPKSDKKMGISVEKTYSEILSNMTPKQEVIVAVIDGGIDPMHEDLKDNMWINSDEIPNNNIDDDNNGYIDDVYGWNFLGNKEGENINEENLELTRIVKELSQKFEGKNASDIPAHQKAEYEYYLTTKQEFDTTFIENSQMYESLSQVKFYYAQTLNVISEKTGEKIKDLDDLDNVKTDDKELKKVIKSLKKAHKQGFSLASLDEAIDYYQKMTENYYGLEFSPRKEILGDNVNSIEVKNYGNNDVKGPDAFHGSFCAGIIAGKRNNSIGVNGINNNVKIMALRAVPNGDEYDKDIALAIIYAVDNGAKVINMSFGKGYSPQKRFVDQAIKYAEKNNVLLVHAAGNDSQNIDFNSNFPTDSMNDGTYTSNLITVGASSMNRKKTTPGNFSNYGVKNVDIFAPGVDIVSTAPDNYYGQANGTSFAAPVVTGVAALILTYYPSLTPAQVKELLMSTVTDISDKKMVIPFENPEDKRKVEFSELCTSGGIVNVYNAFKKLNTK